MSTPSTVKKEPMVQFNLKLPKRVVDRLAKRAKQLSERTGMPVNMSAVARAILTEQA